MSSPCWSKVKAAFLTFGTKDQIQIQSLDHDQQTSDSVLIFLWLTSFLAALASEDC